MGMKLLLSAVVTVLLLNMPETVAAQDSAFSAIQIDPQTVTDLKKVGLPTTREQKAVDVFVLADASEKGFSGLALTSQIQELMRRFPNDIRVWYIHVVLPYRDVRSDVLVSSGCLADQQAFWPNIAPYVENDAKPFPPLGQYPGIGNPEQYGRCVTEGNGLDLSAEKKERLRLLSGVGATGIPSAIFINNASVRAAVKLEGAQPGEHFIRAYETVATLSATQESEIRVSQDSVLSYPVRVWRAFLALLKTILNR